MTVCENYPYDKMHLIRRWRRAIVASELNGTESEMNIWAITITIDNNSQFTKAGKRMVQMKTALLKRRLAVTFDGYLQNHDVDMLLYFELSRKLRPHVHGIIYGDPDSVRDCQIWCQSFFGKQCQLKFPFYSKEHDWLRYMSKDGNVLELPEQ